MSRPLRVSAVLAATVVVALVIVAGLTASPGGLDRRGGHHCWTKCTRYGLYTGQYHCHRAPCSRADIRKHRAHGH
jgi:hypothetical protein